MAGQNFFFLETARAETTMFLTCSIGVSIKQKSKKVCVLRAILKAFAGHIWPKGRMLCMPRPVLSDRDLFYQLLCVHIS